MRLEDINNFFNSSSIDRLADLWMYFVAIICLIVVLVALIMIREYRNRHKIYFPHGTVADPKLIIDILRTAMDQRRTFDAHLNIDDDKHHPYLRCSLLNITKTGLVFELNGIKSLSDNWLNRKFNLFFRVSQSGTFVYYAFRSIIQEIRHPFPESCHVTFQLPSSLENKQKRANLRMPPPSDLVLGSAIWHGENVPTPEQLSDIELWPAPNLFFLPGKAEQYGLMDLSASGVRIFFSHKTVADQSLAFPLNSILILQLDLFDPENNKRSRYWISCRVQNVWKENNSHAMSIGLKFISWARPKENLMEEEPQSTIEWLKLSGNSELEHIGNWIMRRHLEMYRDGQSYLDKK